MKNYLAFLLTGLLLSLTHLKCFANDGAFFASGNQLIPIRETVIQVKKEILTLKKVRNERIEVSVYYEFFNPKEEKELLVGFEAMAPSGDVDGAPKDGKHPYMYDFNVIMNDQALAYQVDYVADSAYIQNGMIQTIDLKTYDGNTAGNEIDFFYVYNFKAKFKKGLNIIRHTYSYDLSGSIDLNYLFEYVLTAANRWANKQIDDFTLILDMGPYESFMINKSFFKNNTDWQIDGKAKVSDFPKARNVFFEVDATHFFLDHGKLIFKQKNFQPKGELFVFSINNLMGALEPDEIPGFLPYSIYQLENIPLLEKNNSLYRKILRNLPFARRGYVFQDEELRKYYEQMDWYQANPKYQAQTADLWPEEKAWLKKVL